MRSQKLYYSFFPAGGVEIASSRIRVYEFQSVLAKNRIATTFGYSCRANVLFFQKKVSRENLWQARIAKAMGCVIIYDVDDLDDALWYYVPEKNFRKMLRIADVVTTCSQAQKEYLSTKFNCKNSIVVPTAVDYFPEKPVMICKTNDNPLRIIWFGSSSNLHMFEKYISVLSHVPDSEVYVVMGNHDLDEYANKYKNINFLPWTLCGFISVLQSCDIACLMHDGRVEDVAKGNNKMIAAITWGVPAVVSRTPEYERTACEAGVEYAVFSNEDELLEVVEKLRSGEARNAYLEASQKIIWEKYSPDVIAQQYINIALELLSKKKLSRLRNFLLSSRNIAFGK